MTRSYTFDAELEFKDAGLIAADAAALVSAAAKIVDLGSATAAFAGVMVVDVTAIEIATDDELYNIIVQGSSSATFASVIENLASFEIGAGAVRKGAADVDGLVGRYEIPFTNEQGGVKYRYLRVFTDVTGTIATGINYTAYAAKNLLP